MLPSWQRTWNRRTDASGSRLGGESDYSSAYLRCLWNRPYGCSCFMFSTEMGLFRFRMLCKSANGRRYLQIITVINSTT